MTRSTNLTLLLYTYLWILLPFVGYSAQASVTTLSVSSSLAQEEHCVSLLKSPEFDDLDIPKEGLTFPPTPYHGLTFAYFSAFDPKAPGLAGLIHPLDVNCAVSAPNALLGSRLYEDGPVASFEVPNTSSTVDGQVTRTFALQKLMIKPMFAPEPGTNLTIRGVRDDDETLSWSVWFPSGFYDMFEVRIEEFSRAKWDGLRKVEIFADFGYGE